MWNNAHSYFSQKIPHFLATMSLALGGSVSPSFLPLPQNINRKDH